MAEPPYPRDEALKRFDERYDALAASSRRTPRQYGSDEGAGAGYRLIGGVLTGLGLGWLLDRFAGTAPFGLIGGVLIGSAAAIYLAVRSAARMSAQPATTTQDSAATPSTNENPAPAPVKMNEGPDQGV